MNKSIVKLAKIAEKRDRLIIGLMSGTSLDGLDIALCRISGSGTESTLSLIHFTTMPYEDLFRQQIRKIFAKRQIDHQILCGLNAYVAEVHSQLILETLKDWNIDPTQIDVIASHGQTVFHAPQSLTGDVSLPNSTLQIGDGDHFAVRTGIITISDFRQKHLAAGGEGAPLAAYGDYLLFSSEEEHRILLNIGGISNFTFLPRVGTNLKAYATDLGPGNTMMNQYMFAHYGEEMDKDAAVAASGRVSSELLSRLKSHPFLKIDFPKTTGPELFNLDYLNACLESVSITEQLYEADVMATLNSFSAQTIVEGIKRAIAGLEKTKIYVSGGGLHNPMLMEQLVAAFPGAVASFQELGLDPDAKEACLFAVLANETLCGDPKNVINIKDSPAVCMGKISLPY
ncbi:anhydro-N-acetylmuramic acid kinase [Sphingobacterium sp. DK4209]|uniref:Anhydro-N-acetylmuramic acid kinase n=1 Tax=Sphingobacterium zhuxiongii TaxID=2662364 RepID=A0A5Q0QD29_9SPHI|nr:MULTISPECIES: anhydro-N-acetylmuramic acid kinase [unclassified Sphingobacterium]MVZ65878.1 anhydro-N-acetylmuramic acid kinase [Sphingobacterium sp. DK4209]QGA28107.1 anhydro-N-acetylmuramic acid kinase [Sphingobacterium sp. dk4302]